MIRPLGRHGARLSVIVSTYNNLRPLELVMACLARQTVRDFELLVADDGSGPATRALVERFAGTAPFPVRHIWHPDDGFRKWAILNRAVVEAEGNYLVFFDGDVVFPARTVERHLRHVRPGRYLAGGKIDLKEPLAGALTVADIDRGIFDRAGEWWRFIGRRRRLFLSYLPGFRELMNRRVLAKLNWPGENSSAWREDILRINGFDERFTYGFGDVDFGHRLRASGIRVTSIRYSCPVFHLDHPRPWYDAEKIAANRALSDRNRAAGAVRTEFGIRPGAAG